MQIDGIAVAANWILIQHDYNVRYVYVDVGRQLDWSAPEQMRDIRESINIKNKHKI